MKQNLEILLKKHQDVLPEDATPVGIIYETKSYEDFKLIKGNRNINPRKVKSLMESISDIGLHKLPIVVDDSLSIGDGQHRFNACRNLNESVYFTVDDDLSLNVCKRLNMHNSNWGLRDFIKSFEVDDDWENQQSYIYLDKLLEVENMSTTLLASALFGIKSLPYTLKNGMLLVTEQDYNRALNVIDYTFGIVNEIPLQDIKSMSRPVSFYQAIMLLYLSEKIRPQRLKDLLKDSYKLLSFNNTDTCIDAIAKLYNKNLKPENMISSEQICRKIASDTRRFMKSINS